MTRAVQMRWTHTYGYQWAVWVIGMRKVEGNEGDIIYSPD